MSVSVLEVNQSAEHHRSNPHPAGPLRGVSLMDFIGFIEVHRLLGVGQFIIYVMDLTEDMNRLLEFYTNQLIVHVIQWECPFSNKDIRFKHPRLNP